jgi:DNA-directed RNA polymerase subunit RPC12/RpoP
MPEAYKCSSCALAFIVGWKHHSGNEDYPESTDLVCSDCGTMHLQEHGRTESIPFGELLKRILTLRSLKYKGLPDKLLVRPAPFFLSREQSALESILDCKISFSEWRFASELPPDVRFERRFPGFEGLEACGERMDLDRVACGACGKIGTLRSEWSDSNCPNCGKDYLESFGSWIT